MKSVRINENDICKAMIDVIATDESVKSLVSEKPLLSMAFLVIASKVENVIFKNHDEEGGTE